MQEDKTKQLFTEVTEEDSATINGGHYHGCGCYSYKKSYYKRSHYHKPSYSYYPAYYSGSPRYCY